MHMELHAVDPGVRTVNTSFCSNVLRTALTSTADLELVLRGAVADDTLLREYWLATWGDRTDQYTYVWLDEAVLQHRQFWSITDSEWCVLLHRA